jgi:hypothetical protein
MVSAKVELYLLNTFSALTIKQEELVKQYIDRIVQGGIYQKTAEIEAMIARGGEKVVSFVDAAGEKQETVKGGNQQQGTGKEDWSIAQTGEYIVTNGSRRREQYILPASEFTTKYVQIQGNKYRPNENAQVYALQVSAENIRKYRLSAFEKLITNPMNPIYIEPIWELSQSLYLNDYLVTPVKKRDQVYGIKKKDFEDTYSGIPGTP